MTITPSILPSVRAELHERFLFNFRVPLDALSRHLPAPFLRAQPLNGWGVLSFCLLDLRGLTVAPLPTLVGLNSLSCAPRFAILDCSDAQSGPAVFVTERFSNSAFGSWFSSLGFSAPHPFIEARIEHGDDKTVMSAAIPGEGALFEASVSPGENTSSLWPDTRDFGEFISMGVRSFGLSRHANRLTVMDLRKNEGVYQPLHAGQLSGTFVQTWQAEGAVFDSAFRTAGGRYEWTYHGLVDAS